MTAKYRQPTEEEKEEIYKFYKYIFLSSFDKQKKINLIYSIFQWAPWSWRVVGISIDALREFKKNDFKHKSGFCRDHFIQDRIVTVKLMLDKILPFEKWWSLFWKNDQTRLITKKEHNSKAKTKISRIIDIDYKLGYFVCQNRVGYNYAKKREGKFLEKLIKDNNLDI